jgi:hypothetical protein
VPARLDHVLHDNPHRHPVRAHGVFVPLSGYLGRDDLIEHDTPVNAPPRDRSPRISPSPRLARDHDHRSDRQRGLRNERELTDFAGFGAGVRIPTKPPGYTELYPRTVLI